jgi:2-oxoisovalerate dehydrogenase E1 component
VVDIRTLLPFDINGMIKDSLKKTSRVLIVFVYVVGGASGFILDQVLNKQEAYFLLDSQPVTIASKDHRPAYGSDGDYFSKPNLDDIVEVAYNLVQEAKPSEFKSL